MSQEPRLKKAGYDRDHPIILTSSDSTAFESYQTIQIIQIVSITNVGCATRSSGTPLFSIPREAKNALVQYHRQRKTLVLEDPDEDPDPDSDRPAETTGEQEDLYTNPTPKIQQ